MRFAGSFICLILSLLLANAGYAAPGQSTTSTASIKKARKLILQLQSWNLEDESPPVGQFRALQKQVSNSVIELFRQGRIQDAKTLAAWNKAVASKHFSKDSIPYLAAMSDIVISSASGKNHKASKSEFESLYQKLKNTDSAKEANAIKNKQDSVLLVKQVVQKKDGKVVKTVKTVTRSDDPNISAQLEYNRRQIERARAINAKLR